MYRILVSILIFNFLLTQDYPEPVNLSTYVDNGNIEVVWGEIILDNITGYKIYRNNNELLLTSDNVHTDREIENDVPYCYTVTALYDNSIESEHSNMSCASWQINPPIDFSINPDDESVYLQWDEPEVYDEIVVGYHSNWDGWSSIGDAGPLNFSPVIRFTPSQLQDAGIDETTRKQ